MIDIEEVINAINICLGHGNCKDCTYHSTEYTDQNCRGRMLKDILTLLKKQEYNRKCPCQECHSCMCDDYRIWAGLPG